MFCLSLLTQLLMPCKLYRGLPCYVWKLSSLFFIDKITSTRALISPSAYEPSFSVPCSAILDKFENVTLPFLHEIFDHLKHSGSPNYAVPPRLFKEVLPTVGPSFLAVNNSSLSSGVVPENITHAVVQPLIKKTALDPAFLANFRPVSKLPFLSKTLEKTVFSQLAGKAQYSQGFT